MLSAFLSFPHQIIVPQDRNLGTGLLTKTDHFLSVRVKILRGRTAASAWCSGCFDPSLTPVFHSPIRLSSASLSALALSVLSSPLCIHRVKGPQKDEMLYS